MKPKYYVLLVWNDIEPELHGPYGLAAARNDRARVLKQEHGDDNGIFALDINRKGQPKVRAYSSAFFTEAKT